MSADTPRRQGLPPSQTQHMPRRLVDRWAAHRLLADLSGVIGLNPTDLAVLRAHFTVLPKGQIDITALNMSYMQAKKICDRADGRSESSVRRSEVKLEKLGLVSRIQSANNRRYCRRKAGAVIDARGIDLSPLFRRLVELDELRSQVQEVEEDKRNLASDIKCMIEDLRRSFVNASDAVMGQILRLRDEVRRRLRRVNLTIEDLETIKDDIQKFSPKDEPEIEDVESQCSDVEAPCPTKGSRDPKEAHSGKFTAVNFSKSASSGHAKFTQPPVKKPVDDMQNERHIESLRKEKQIRETSPLSPSMFRTLWAETEVISVYFSKAPERPSDVAEILIKFAAMVGISSECATEAMNTLGLESFIKVIDYVGKKVDVIRNHTAYLKKMLRDFQEGLSIADGTVRQRSGSRLPLSIPVG